MTPEPPPEPPDYRRVTRGLAPLFVATLVALLALAWWASR